MGLIISIFVYLHDMAAEHAEHLGANDNHTHKHIRGLSKCCGHVVSVTFHCTGHLSNATLITK